MRGILLAVAATLVFAATAQAATVHDLQSLGYTVKVVSQSQNCKLWVASGFGISPRSSAATAPPGSRPTSTRWPPRRRPAM